MIKSFPIHHLSRECSLFAQELMSSITVFGVQQFLLNSDSSKQQITQLAKKVVLYFHNSYLLTLLTMSCCNALRVHVCTHPFQKLSIRYLENTVMWNYVLQEKRGKHLPAHCTVFRRLLLLIGEYAAHSIVFSYFSKLAR